MKKKSGSVTNIQRKEGENGDYLVVSIDEERYSVFDNQLFKEFEEGEDVKVQYKEKEKGGNVYRNIKKANMISSTGSSSSGSSTNKGSQNLKAQALLSACIFANAVDKQISSDDILKVSKKFHGYLLGD